MNAYVSSARPKQRKRLIIVIAAVVILFGLLIAFNTFKGIMIGKFMKSMANPPQTVSTMTAEYQDWQPHVEAVGNVRAVHGSDLAFDVAGLVESVDVKSGTDVKKGQVLVKLVDDQDRATLASLQAAAQLAALTAERSKKQLAVQAISKAQYDTDMANLKSAQANAASQQALVDKKTLRAPFAGRVGIITANAGQYISAGTAVVTLQQLDPVYVDFTVPQSSLATLRTGGKVEVTADAFKGKTFSGEVSATDPKIDLSTRNVGVEATIANPDKLLMPGMFTKVAVDSGSQQRYLTLPQTAISYAPYGDTVFVVREGQPPASGDDGKPAKASANAAKDKNAPDHYVQQVVVTVGPTRGDQVAVLSGIKAGDVVVTSGQLKLRNDTPVNINNKVEPAFSPNPHPVEE
ncbi:MAG: CzcABC family efflux RND transporter, membrane fusion protein [Rhodanobacteraceae bacterium]|jgi:membrane fusion protein (multidrug efflux system)|nr:MAG: CzcABC family efflux RND transporter, membrane fusion protein [Rhodanobacteraceae bacterium]